MSKPVFVLDDDLTVTSPVHIQQPTSARTGGGKSQQGFVTRTAYVTFRVPTEDELDDVSEQVQRHNEAQVKRIADVERERSEATDDAERAAAERRLTELRRELRLQQAEQLKAFVVDLPEGHGFAEKDGTPCEFSPDLIGRLCQYRAVRAALWTAFLLVLNGDPKRGN
ncbi:hypothetical protein [Azospirillum agricola]|uniref:hypothetical protein n=1 Tax=Azospirillum agricola TaxID=1720247 RepID=UPI000A0EFD12|nr:hypothetical protein [Azospirillum agricola]SMH62530.1 hypothetical protein SAMN02982994_6333 [Azospirillum lipoferum]